MNDTCKRVDAAVSEWEQGRASDSQSLFFIINHSRTCARCGRNHGALIPLIRRDAGEHSELAAVVEPLSPAFTDSIMRRATRVKVHHFSGATMQTARWVLPLAGCVALILGVGAFVLQARAHSQQAILMVRFTLNAPSASRVSLAGDWNGWRPVGLNPKAGQNGVWEIAVPLRAGAVYTYEFLIDGQKWVPDPHSESQIDDGFGGLNSVLRL